MSKLLDLIWTLVPHMPSPEEREESYLAGSSDLFELERRMHAVQP